MAVDVRVSVSLDLDVPEVGRLGELTDWRQPVDRPEISTKTTHNPHRSNRLIPCPLTNPGFIASLQDEQAAIIIYQVYLTSLIDAER
jgi:hypothetical protein